MRAQAYAGEPLVAAVRMYGRSPSQLTDLSGRIELISLNDATKSTPDTANIDIPAIAVNAALDEVKDTGAEAIRDVMFSVPLDHVPPGEYVARAIVTSHGESVADLRRQVQVIAGVAPARATATASTRPRDVIGGAIAQRLTDAVPRLHDAAFRRPSATSSARDGRLRHCTAAR